MADRRSPDLKPLRQFLMDAFEPPQLERFLLDYDYKQVASEVSKKLAKAQYTHEVLQELNRQNRIDAKLFDNLMKERPGHQERLSLLAASLLAEDSTTTPAEKLTLIQIEELVDMAGHAGLLSYDVQMALMHQVQPNLPKEVRLAPTSTDLLRSTLQHLNRLPGAGMERPLAHWLSLAINTAEGRGFAGPYRRALESMLGAEYRTGDELDIELAPFDHSSPLPDSMLTIDFLSLGLRAAASVCLLRVFLCRDGNVQRYADGKKVFSTVGTGWLITPSLVVTAWHNIAGDSGHGQPEMADIRLQAVNAECQFDYEAGLASSSIYHVSRLLAWDERSDIILLRLEGETQRSGLKLRPAESGVIGSKDRVSMIHHGWAKRKLLSLRGRVFSLESIKVMTALPDHFRLSERILYDAPSIPGSSGAPLFDDGWRLTGFHLGHVRLPTEEKGIQRLGFGTPIDAIQRFVSGEGISCDDAKLTQIALAEIQALATEKQSDIGVA
jgi:hypothetical protein